MIFDVDYGYETGDDIVWLSVLRLYDADGKELALDVAGDRYSNSRTAGGSGSSTDNDAYLAKIFNMPGTYYLEIANDNRDGLSDGWKGIAGLPEGVTYRLQVSFEGHAVSDFTFTADPVLEQEGPGAYVQNVDDSANWYTFYNPEIITRDDEGNINFITPYVTIQGTGDFTWDSYEFEVDSTMLVRYELSEIYASADPDVNVADTADYYLSASIELTGTVGSGDVWTLTLDGIAFDYTSTAADTLDTVALALTGLVDGTLSYEASASGSVMTISDYRGFRYDGLTHYINKAAVVTRTLGTAVDPVRFSQAR